LFIEGEGAAISDALAIEQGDMAAENSRLHPIPRHRLANLQFDAHTWQQPAVCFDERASFRNVDDSGGSTGAQAPVSNIEVFDGGDPGPCPSFFF
jgi:hypothetical protein